MRAEVWCKQDYGHDRGALKVWSGNLPAIPREGEYVVIFDGWASARVEDIHYFLYEEEPYAMIEIGADTTGEYEAKLNEKATDK